MNLPIDCTTTDNVYYCIIFEESFNCCIKTEMTVLYLIMGI